MAVTLAELGQDVIGVDGEEERVRQVADVLAQATRLDATDARALKEAGIQDVDVAIVSIGEDIESSLLVVMQLKELELRPRFGLTLIAVKRAAAGGVITTNISRAAEETIHEGDPLALLGSNESIAKMNQQLETK